MNLYVNETLSFQNGNSQIQMILFMWCWYNLISDLKNLASKTHYIHARSFFDGITLQFTQVEGLYDSIL